MFISFDGQRMIEAHFAARTRICCGASSACDSYQYLGLEDVLSTSRSVLFQCLAATVTGKNKV